MEERDPQELTKPWLIIGSILILVAIFGYLASPHGSGLTSLGGESVGGDTSH